MPRLNNNTIIVVPVHTPDLSTTDRISLRQCVQVLGHHEITIAHPRNISVAAIKDKFGIANSASFPEHCFSSYHEYNRTIHSDYFYQRFINYEHMLLHELDAFVFYDALYDWSNTPYDYIGAPLYSISQDAINYCRNAYWPLWAKSDIAWRLLRRKVGILVNGGFSLRRIPKMLSISKRYRKKAQLWGRNDDLFWSAAVAAYSPRLNIPEPEICAQFALMIDVKAHIDNSGGKLPFGCHGWTKYETDFWRPHIQSFGHHF